MKKTPVFLMALLLALSCVVFAGKQFRLGIVIMSADAETVWNAFRLANFSLQKGDEVRVFLTAKGVDYEKLSSDKFDIIGLAKSFKAGGGSIAACATCLNLRNKPGTELCPVSNMANLYDIIKTSDRVLTY
jgi:sulfur relay (sulfurtransferase) complex TusBCD TusD component (DsrE family)